MSHSLVSGEAPPIRVLAIDPDHLIGRGKADVETSESGLTGRSIQYPRSDAVIDHMLDAVDCQCPSLGTHGLDATRTEGEKS